MSQTNVPAVLETAPMHPAFAGFLAQAAAQDNPPLESLPPEVGRQIYRDLNKALNLPPPDIARTDDRTVEGPGGSLTLRVYTPIGAAGASPVLLYLHGGGWVIGDLDTHDEVCRRLCHGAHAIVVALDYRRAPEHPFPAALDDAEAALAWLALHAGELGGNADRVALAGDSAGGQLCAALAQRVAGKTALRALGLIYPVAQHYAAPSASYAENGEGKFLTTAVMTWFTDQYLAGQPGAAEHPDFKLLGSSRLDRLPPTWVATMGHDVLRDEGHALAQQVEAAGVEVRHRHWPDGIHACIHFTAVAPTGAQLLDELAAWLRPRLA
ncbi:MAG TPA: alpha/beta hydrolase [Hydrogenophaga sp.]|nr:alpha/beta hydrolase [Hydrogenophaga sp.]